MHAIAFTFLAAVTNRRRTATTKSDTAVCGLWNQPQRPLAKLYTSRAVMTATVDHLWLPVTVR